MNASNYKDNIILDVLPSLEKVTAGASFNKIVIIKNVDNLDYIQIGDMLLDNDEIKGYSTRISNIYDLIKDTIDTNRIIKCSNDTGIVYLEIDADNAIVKLSEKPMRFGEHVSNRIGIKGSIKYKDDRPYNVLTYELASHINYILGNSYAGSIITHNYKLKDSNARKLTLLGKNVEAIKTGKRSGKVVRRFERFTAADIAFYRDNDEFHIYSEKPLKACAAYKRVGGEHASRVFPAYMPASFNVMDLSGLDFSTLENMNNIAHISSRGISCKRLILSGIPHAKIHLAYGFNVVSNYKKSAKLIYREEIKAHNIEIIDSNIDFDITTTDTSSNTLDDWIQKIFGVDESIQIQDSRINIHKNE